MNTFYTQHIYVLYQNENEYTRFKNYIEKYKIKLDYEMIKSVPVVLDENLNNKKNLNSTCKYLNNYMKRYINYKLNPKQISHIKSIKKIINNAIINNYDSITILEYDVLFHKNFSDLLPNYKNLITVDEQSTGGLSTIILELLNEHKVLKNITCIKLPEKYFFENGEQIDVTLWLPFNSLRPLHILGDTINDIGTEILYKTSANPRAC